MTPADRRITELIDKWLASIDLHLKYVELSDAAYVRVQAWPKHDRPTRWVLEVARQKILELEAHCETRQAMGDGKFAESLELMAFLANLVGIQHIQRFIPLADPTRDASVALSQTVELIAAERPAERPAPKARPSGDETTREMPRLKTSSATRSAPAAAAKRQDGAKNAAAAARAAPAAATAPKAASAVDLRGKIIADAVRLLKWGKSWHELADLIERIAERPPASEIRKVLRAHRSEIEEKAAAQG